MLRRARPVVDAPGNQDPGEHHDVLLNLGESIPSFFARFDRVAEVVLNEAAARGESRKRWAFYKDRGYELAHHDMQHLRGGGER